MAQPEPPRPGAKHFIILVESFINIVISFSQLYIGVKKKVIVKSLNYYKDFIHFHYMYILAPSEGLTPGTINFKKNLERRRE